MSTKSANPVQTASETKAPLSEAETAEMAKEETAKVGAPTTTPNETIAGLLPKERLSRSAALKIIRDQGIKCSQERMTVIMEGLYGAAPTKEEREKVRAEAKAVKDAEKEKAREAKKAEREAKAIEKREAKEKATAEAKPETAKPETAKPETAKPTV